MRSKKIDVAVIDGKKLIIKRPGSKLSLTGPLSLLLATEGRPLPQTPIRALEKDDQRARATQSAPSWARHSSSD